MPIPRHSVDGARVILFPDSLVCTWRGTAVLATDGSVNVIGPDDFMQHGAASTSARAPVTFATGDKCIKLNAGSEHFAAALAPQDCFLRIVTRGRGEHGQLGIGSVLHGAPRSVAEFKAVARLHAASGAAFVVAVVIRQPNK
jgi:hypothetical protein